MAQQQQLDMGKWKGLFEWSMKYQGGDREGAAPQPLDPEKKAWLDQALQEFMRDFADRMKEITTSLAAADPAAAAAAAAAAGDSDAPADNTKKSLAAKEALCDELMEIVENVDYARDLHKIGGLPTLLSLMASPHPSLRWRAAEIAGTCMANNPPVQRWFMEAGVLSPLLALLSDSHPVVATKALLGLSALVRHYEPSLEAFRLGGGLEKLLALLGCNTDPAIQPAGQQQQQQQPADDGDDQQRQRRRLQRKVLALLQYVLAKHPRDGFAAAEFGLVPKLQQLLVSSSGGGDASDMQSAALAVLAEVVSTPEGWQWVRQHHQDLVPCLQQLQQQQQQSGDDDTAEEEQLRQLLQVLASDTPPQPRAQGLADHIELDPYQDGRERAVPQTLPLPSANKPGVAEESSQPPPQLSPGAEGWALAAVPQQDLR